MDSRFYGLWNNLDEIGISRKDKRSQKMPVKIKIGDIVEIKTAKGLAYGVYTNKHDAPPRFGALIRILDGSFSSRPSPIEDIFGNVPVRFSVFFPLQAAVTKGLVEIVGNVALPSDMSAFPVFRSGLIDPKTKKVNCWWLWDGKREWRIGQLTAEQRKLPIRGVWNDTLLVKRIEQGWRP